MNKEELIVLGLTEEQANKVLVEFNAKLKEVTDEKRVGGHKKKLVHTSIQF
ncbi:hypothetical protein [Streptobacillus moniliformis]|uniref:hypothetical protein n=1 Tax=Streptobacillus moniliformis TaxID=34105 RepID=UPI000B1A42A8|nr:hypothetical protein [Streptobacillus moniliformis]